jgi:hypothetical protein
VIHTSLLPCCMCAACAIPRAVDCRLQAAHPCVFCPPSPRTQHTPCEPCCWTPYTRILLREDWSTMDILLSTAVNQSASHALHAVGGSSTTITAAAQSLLQQCNNVCVLHLKDQRPTNQHQHQLKKLSLSNISWRTQSPSHSNTLAPSCATSKHRASPLLLVRLNTEPPPLHLLAAHGQHLLGSLSQPPADHCSTLFTVWSQSTPKWSQSGANVEPTWSQSGAKVEPTWSQGVCCTLSVYGASGGANTRQTHPSISFLSFPEPTPGTFRSCTLRTALTHPGPLTAAIPLVRPAMPRKQVAGQPPHRIAATCGGCRTAGTTYVPVATGPAAGRLLGPTESWPPAAPVGSD